MIFLVKYRKSKLFTAVRLDLFDLEGRQLGTLLQNNLGSGEQSINLDAKAMNLPSGPRIYQLTIANEYGVFRQCKLMARE
jgi:hypothetical protein